MSELDKYPKSNPFKVPDGYFEGFEEKLSEKTGSQEPEVEDSWKIRSLKPFLTIAAGFIIIFSLWFIFLDKVGSSKTETNTETQEFEAILSYFESIDSENGQDDWRERFEAQKVAFITKQLNLTVEEAQQFWPVYNEYQQKKEEVLKKRRTMLVKLSNKEDELTDNELNNLSDTYVNLQLEEAKQASTYHEKFKAVLSLKKVVAYYQAEEKFKRFLLRQVRETKGTQR